MTEHGTLSVQCRPHELRVPGFSLLPTGLIADGEPSFEDWSGLAAFLRNAEGAVHWWIGDWLNYGERRWGDRYQEVVRLTGFQYQTIANDKWLAGKVKFSARAENLTHAHHKAVARLLPPEQQRWLAVAVAEKLTAAGLRNRVAQVEGRPTIDGCTSEDLRVLLARGWRFGTVYADPPWAYANQATRSATDGHYGTMSWDEMAALPVGELALPESHLHLWATKDFIPEALRLIDAWGFVYKSMFVWCKPSIGLGNYWRMAHELLLLGVRGSCPFRRKDLKSWEVFETSGHSEKPERVALWLEETGPGPYVELFGRAPRPGWVVWGNEVERTLFYREAEGAFGTHHENGAGAT